MEDRHKYRAIETRFNKLVTGYYLFCKAYESHVIYSPNTNLDAFIIHNIDYKTLEKCTGLNDKNKKLIFEGDIGKSYNDEIGYVIYDDEQARFKFVYWNDWGFDSPNVITEILGNKSENPELLEKNKNKGGRN